MELGQQITDKLKEAGIKVPELATLLDIPKGRIYKWQKGHAPHDAKDYIKITNWIESVPHGTDEHDVSRQGKKPGMQYTPITTTDRRQEIARPVSDDPLILEMKTTIARLMADNEYLRKQNEKLTEKLMSMLDNSMQKS